MGLSTPASTLTDSVACMKRRDGNTGMATMSLPLALAMSSDEKDISKTSNSPNLSCRQNVSDGSELVQTRSTPSTSTSP